MTTFAPSQPTLFGAMELSSTRSAAASHARTSAPLESKLASKLAALASGTNSSGSLASYDHASSSWRTSQTCLVAQANGQESGLAEFSEGWPRSGMMRSGTAFQLQPSAPLTYGTGYGSSPSHSIPTPCASDNIVREETFGQLNYETNKAVTLPRFVQMWPTPTLQDARGRDRHNQKDGSVILSLLGEAREWPTPTARLGDKRRGMPSVRLAKERYAQGRRNLDDAVAMWPTPTANRWSGLQSHGKNAVLGKLNPIFVEWLMDFPMSWTMSVELLSALSETQLSHESQG